jgi:hypothetical protein
MAELEALSVETDVVARVVINERTGTVVVGGNVRISAAAVAHGNLSVSITTTLTDSQSLPYSRGETVVVPNRQVDVREGTAKLVTLPEGATLDSVASALNALRRAHARHHRHRSGVEGGRRAARGNRHPLIKEGQPHGLCTRTRSSPGAGSDDVRAVAGDES